MNEQNNINVKVKPTAQKQNPVKASVPVKGYTPKQIDFAMRYYVPSSPTYGNALQSALKAGYSREYAENITTFNLEWMERIVSEIIGKPDDKNNLLAKAKKVLNKSLDSRDEKIAQDTAKFIAKTDPEFSEKQDITSNGQPLDTVKITLVDASKKKTEVVKNE